MRRTGWFYYSCAAWGLSLICAAAAWFMGMTNLFAFPMFAIMPEWVALIYTGNKEGITQYDILHECPRVCKIITVGSILYGIICFLFGMYILREGGPHIDNGVYCLWNHGFVREITQEEYKALSKMEGAMFTGVYLVFSSISMAYFSARDKINCYLG